MRISSAGAVLLLAACSQGGAEATTAGGADTLIECAVSGAAGFARECSVEEALVDGAGILIVRHPDGAFRRFERTPDGTGLITADGVQPATVTSHEGRIEVAVGTDRYRFPTSSIDHGGR